MFGEEGSYCVGWRWKNVWKLEVRWSEWCGGGDGANGQKLKESWCTDRSEWRVKWWEWRRLLCGGKEVMCGNRLWLMVAERVFCRWDWRRHKWFCFGPKVRERKRLDKVVHFLCTVEGVCAFQRRRRIWFLLQLMTFFFFVFFDSFYKNEEMR